MASQNDAVKPPTAGKLPPSPDSNSSDHHHHHLHRFPKSAALLSLLLSLSLLLYFSSSSPSFPSPARFFFLRRRSSATASACSAAYNLSDAGPTSLTHIQFGLGGSTKTWPDRKHYAELWWDPGSTRGFVWLDEQPSPNSTRPDASPPYRVSSARFKARRPSDRMARILKESFEEGLPGVRWFVMGDDDTVFFRRNLAAVLSKYDHRRMYYVGGTSESVEQDVMHGYDTAFGGGGFAVSRALACEMVRILDGCIERYRDYYGSDEKVAACVAEIGVPLTREAGFHQLDIRDDPYGLLAAHSVAPLVSLHHLDYVKPLFPGQTQMDSLKRLMGAYDLDPPRILQQSICYDHRRKWSLSISWGYTAQLYPSLVPARVLTTPLRTFRTWRSWHDEPFVFNTRPLNADPCGRPIIYFLDKVKDNGDGKTTTTIYKRVDEEKKCNQSAYKHAMSVHKITVLALKTDPEESLKVLQPKAPRRQCCEIETSSWTMRNMRVKIRSCKPGETITV